MKLRWSKKYRTDAGKEYGSFDVSLPPVMVKEIGWAPGIELEAVRVRDTIIIRRSMKKS